jgi:prepilin-type N-terminal cleavage/methylation domain-containing protein
VTVIAVEVPGPQADVPGLAGVAGLAGARYALAVTRGPRLAARPDRGFSLVEIVIALAVLAVIVGIALPMYLGSLSVGGKPGTSVVNTKSNKAAVDEAAYTADAWRSTAYTCYLQSLNVSSCSTNEAIGFTEPAGKYWNWTSGAQNGVAGATYSVVNSFGEPMALTVSWPSNNAGLESGETYVVSLFISGTSQGHVTTTCLPVSC